MNNLLKVLGILAFILYLSFPAFCAPTFTHTDNMISITTIDADVDVPDELYGMDDDVFVEYIVFYPGAVNDILVVEQDSASGARIFQAKSVDGGALVLYIEAKCRPYIDYSDCTLTAGHAVLMKIK